MALQEGKNKILGNCTNSRHKINVPKLNVTIIWAFMSRSGMWLSMHLKDIGLGVHDTLTNLGSIVDMIGVGTYMTTTLSSRIFTLRK
jgi:hypothetical protein